MNYHAAPRGKLCPLIVFQRNVLNFFSAKFILQIILTNFPKPSWPPPFFTVVKEISLITERCWRLLNFADLGTEWMKQAYKNVDTTLQNAVSSINKKNGTCDISAISQYVSKLPANVLLGWGSAGSLVSRPEVCIRHWGVLIWGRFFFFYFLFPQQICTWFYLSKTR